MTKETTEFKKKLTEALERDNPESRDTLMFVMHTDTGSSIDCRNSSIEQTMIINEAAQKYLDGLNSIGEERETNLLRTIFELDNSINNFQVRFEDTMKALDGINSDRKYLHEDYDSMAFSQREHKDVIDEAKEQEDG